jgi:cell volume regulation protein A
LLGVPVTERLGTRGDAPGALVRLADHRYALTGRILAVGSRRQLDRFIRRRARHADGADWYAEARRLLHAEAREPSAEDGV